MGGGHRYCPACGWSDKPPEAPQQPQGNKLLPNHQPPPLRYPTRIADAISSARAKKIRKQAILREKMAKRKNALEWLREQRDKKRVINRGGKGE